MAASSSSSASGWKHEVFLSFRGEDTRNTFTAHLYHGLRAKGINTFIDNELERGHDISDSLVKVIEGSRISIVIFSTDYAGSSSCLEELVKILECQNLKGQLVLPVFYNVNPSDVEKQTGCYPDSLAKLEAHLKVKTEKMREWRLALTQASALSGWHLDNRNEAELIQTIIKKVSMLLNHMPLHVAEYPVGLDSHIQEMTNILSFGMDEVQFVGVHGLGGIGKTTITKAVFNIVADRFEGSCFLANVRETTTKKGLLKLQKTLLKETLGLEGIELGNCDKGINVIRQRLCGKRVLIAIDDVDELEQLKTLVGAMSWFGPGSRIIITTRDEQLLKAHGVERIHYVKELSDSYALELFSWNAFKKPQPNEDYLELSSSIINYAQGLPLALVVLGSLLSSESKSVWERQLLYLKRSPNKEVNNILKISFDGLADFHKDIFLHISCFFKGCDKDHVMKILDACDLYPDIGVPVLVKKSLIRIEDDTIEMHDLVQAMGRQIVNDESPNIGERSRLWKEDDIFQVLTEDMGPLKTEALVVDCPHSEEINADVFAKMKRLKILIIYNATISGNLEGLWNDLRWLKWHDYPLESLPSTFRARKLVALDLNHSCIKELSATSFKSFVNLKRLELQMCYFLTKTPDFSTLSYLEYLRFDYCINLVEVHESVGYLNKLEVLGLCYCFRLEILPSRFQLTSLHSILLESCKKLEMFPEIVEKMTCLEKIDLRETAIKSLPSSISNISGLKVLILSGCEKFEMFPEIKEKMTCLENIDLSMTAIKSLSSSISNISGLKVLTLWRCKNLEMFPEIVKKMTSLEEIDLSETAIKSLPSSIVNITGLKKLNLHRCKKLEMFPEIVEKMTCLEKIDLSETAIKSLPSSISNISGLKVLTLRCCKKLEVFPEILEKMTWLEEIDLSENAIKSLPLSIVNITGFKELNLRRCKNLEMFPEIMKKMTCLEKIDLSETAIMSLPSSISNISGLKVLILRGCEMFEMFPEMVEEMTCVEEIDLTETAIKFLPSSISYFKHLKRLYLRGCVKLEKLPRSIKWLDNLSELQLSRCMKLQEIPELPLNIKLLEASGCYSLAGRYSQLQKVFTFNWKAEPVVTFDFSNCLNLTKSQDSILADGLQNQEFGAKSRIEVVLPGNKIPEWFNFTWENKTSLSFQVTSEAYEKLEALVLCAIIQPKAVSTVLIVNPQTVLFVNAQIVHSYSGGFFSFYTDHDHVWFYYLPRCSFRKHVTTANNDDVQFKVSIRDPWFPDWPFKSRGVYLVYG